MSAGCGGAAGLLWPTARSDSDTHTQTDGTARQRAAPGPRGLCADALDRKSEIEDRRLKGPWVNTIRWIGFFFYRTANIFLSCANSCKDVELMLKLDSFLLPFYPLGAVQRSSAIHQGLPIDSEMRNVNSTRDASTLSECLIATLCNVNASNMRQMPRSHRRPDFRMGASGANVLTHPGSGRPTPHRHDRGLFFLPVGL